MQVPAENIVLVIVIITLIFLIVGIAMVMYVRLYNQRKRKHFVEKEKMQADFERLLLQSQIEVQESTASALSKELHDNIGQLLSTTKMLLGITERKMGTVPDTFLTAHATLSKAIVELRTLSKSLDKDWIEQFSFLENLSIETSRINSDGATQVHLQSAGNIPLPPAEQIVLFRIVQEAIQNAIKHACAQKIVITTTTSHKLTLSVEDDGQGFKGTAEGMGMKNMQKRARLLGGTVRWQNRQPSGTLVFLEIPLKKNYED